jgi:hypothetical protein
MKKYNVYPLLSYTLFLSSFFIPLVGFIGSFFSGHYLLEYATHKNNRLTLIYIILFIITYIIFYMYHTAYIVIILYPSLFFYIYNKPTEKKIVIQKNGLNPISISFIPALIVALILLYAYNFDATLLEELKIATEKIKEYVIYKDLYNGFVISDTNLKNIINLIPSFISIYTILINYITIKLFVRTKNYQYYFKIPDYYLPIFVITGFLIIANNNVLKLIGINSLIIFGTLFFLQGIDILNYALNKFLKKKTFIKTLIYIIIISQLPCIIFLTIIGIFDNWFNFMKYINAKKT